MNEFGFINLLPFLLSFVFLLAAVILLIVVPLRMRKNSSVCSVPVTAKIVNYVRDYFGHYADVPRSSMFAPVFEFFYNGEVKSVASRLYSNRMPNIGEVRTLMIDPRNPDHFYDPSTRGRTRMITTIVGAGMLVMGILAAIVGVVLLLSVGSF